MMTPAEIVRANEFMTVLLEVQQLLREYNVDGALEKIAESQAILARWLQ